MEISKLYNLRVRRQIYAKDVAFELGIREWEYLEIESGRKKLAHTSWQRIADAFGVPVEEILEGY